MSASDDDFLESIPESPEVFACLRIIVEYQERRLTLEEAAPRLREALRANPPGINLEMTPRLRALFAEVAKLEGNSFPDPGPDPDRHKSRGQRMRSNLRTEAWKTIEKYPGTPRSFGCFFAAGTEERARAIQDWLVSHGVEVTLESPEEADADDWMITAYTPTNQWTKQAVDKWVDSILNAPLNDEASFTGWNA